jgi:anti-anti-sigma regulatory factor
MNINIVAIIQFYGAMNVTQFVTDAQKLYDAGTRNLVLDMSGLTFIGSAGVSALQKIALVYCGEDQPTSKEDQSTTQATPDESEDGFRCQEHIKLLNPNEAIQDVLDIVGLKSFFEIFTDLEAAVASFQLVSQP